MWDWAENNIAGVVTGNDKIVKNNAL